MKTKLTHHPEKRILWEGLSAFEITPATIGLTFEKRLAREQNWGLDRAIAVTQEYRKFFFLMLTADHPVTPSEDVDAAWHLHLLYTQRYAAMCQQFAGRFIHHTPTEGGSAEGHKFVDLYERTLKLYEDWFGYPPKDIWPDSAQRFAHAGAGHWFNPTTHFLIPRPKTIFQRWMKGK